MSLRGPIKLCVAATLPDVKMSKNEKVKKLRLVARSLVDNAIDGDTAAIKEVFDRMDGKVTLEHNANINGAMNVTVVFADSDD
jgi:hypothetical protein